MPLVIICGYPSSGKTTLALKLKNFLDSKLAVDASARDFNGTSIKSVQLVNEEFLQLPSNDYFMSKI
jgi:tRNA uridine 5-carbamoylmethylation protein Kti12